MSKIDSDNRALRLIVACNGVDQDDLSVISCGIRHALNAVPWARLVIADGDMTNNESPLSDGDLFKPGTPIEIRAGYADKDTVVFSGIVVRHGYKITGDNFSRLIVECRDKACKLLLGRKSANHVDKTDSSIIETLISDAGLTADVERTTITHKELVQYYCSDWDFMLARAEMLGLLVNVSAGTVSVKAPAVSAAVVLTLTWQRSDRAGCRYRCVQPVDGGAGPGLGPCPAGAGARRPCQPAYAEQPGRSGRCHAGGSRLATHDGAAEPG